MKKLFLFTLVNLLLLQVKSQTILSQSFSNASTVSGTNLVANGSFETLPGTAVSAPIRTTNTTYSPNVWFPLWRGCSFNQEASFVWTRSLSGSVSAAFDNAYGTVGTLVGFGMTTVYGKASPCGANIGYWNGVFGGGSNLTGVPNTFFNDQVAPAGANVVYFGDGNDFVNSAPNPVFNATTGEIFASSPSTSAFPIGYKAGGISVSLSQTVTGLTIGNTYCFQFWLGSENEGYDGILQVQLGSKYLAYATPGSANLHYTSKTGKYFVTKFTAQATSLPIVFTAFGHFVPADLTLAASKTAWTTWAGGDVNGNMGEPIIDAVTLVDCTPVALVSVSGNVFNDPDAGNVNNSTGATNLIPSGISAYLLDGTGKIVAIATVATDGTYSFPNIAAGNYTVEISTTSASVGSAAPAITMPAGWFVTGDHNGTSTGNDNTTPAGQSAVFTVGATNVTDINFGIQQPPTAVSSTMATQPNNGYSIPVPPTQFSGTDPSSGGTVQSILITAFPKAGGVDVASITINGVKYTSAAAFNAAFPTGATISANSSGNPLQAIAVQPVSGNTNSIIIPYKTIDNGGAVSPSATVTIPIASILPVNFGSIAATVNGCSAVVGFSTLSELNTDRFVLESSIDGTNWYAISTLAAKPSPTGGASYSFVDAGANYGTNYYRIKAVDKDGHFVYSATVTAKVGCSKVTVTAAPNPFANMLKISQTGFAAGAAIQIISPEGRVLIIEKMGAGASTATINTAALPKGSYLVKVTDSKNNSTQKLIKL